LDVQRRKTKIGSTTKMGPTPETDLRAQIVEFAAQAFMAKGFSATSVDDVARLMGCTKGLIYYHFKDKTDLFFAIHRQAMNENLANVEKRFAAQTTAKARLLGMARAHVDGILNRFAFQRVAVLGLEMHVHGATTLEQRVLLQGLLELYDRYAGLFAQVISQGISEGVFVDGDPKLLVKPVLGALNWMVMWYRPRESDSPQSLQQLRDEQAAFVLRGLLKPVRQARTRRPSLLP
jgi:AcrR family transcriptional regulator